MSNENCESSERIAFHADHHDRNLSPGLGSFVLALTPLPQSGNGRVQEGPSSPLTSEERG
jgi:hypothetical protein